MPRQPHSSSKALRGSAYRGQDTSLPDAIVIERREVVGIIAPDSHGEHPMMRAAFMAVSDAMADSLSNQDSQRYEFTHGSHTFEFHANPTTTNQED